MTKLEEMWAALAVYQPQADAAEHGESWAKMCREKTFSAAHNAYDAASAAYFYASDAAQAAATKVQAADAAAAACYACVEADAASADKLAQKAIDRINKPKESK